jgi:membrane protein DedA with SNARE-associated domain
MESILETISTHPGLWVFALLFACGLGLPPWSEELVILASGWAVAQGHFSYLAAVLWCGAGILAGDSLLFALGRLAGDRVQGWPILRRALRPKRRQRFNEQFLRYGTRVVFFARFLPGVRTLTYLVAGNLGMPWWKFLTLDGLGALITVPVSVWLGWKFAANLDEVQLWLHRFQVPLAILGVAAGAWLILRFRRRRGSRLKELLLRRKRREGEKGGRENG